jgi:Gas vesicle protein
MARKKSTESGDWLFPTLQGGADENQSSLLDVIDSVLNRGAVVNGDVVLGVANVDLVYVKLSALLAAFDKVTSRKPHRTARPAPAKRQRRR